jgi:DNA replication factor GINS
MNVEELRSVQRTERQKDSLQHLRDSFYRDVADYVAERKAERKRVAAAADDPFSSPAVSRLTDEIETAEEVVESIYERRVGKIVKRATFAAAGMATEDEGLTTEERELFDDLVARIERNRETVLDTLASDADVDPTADGREPTGASGDGAAGTSDAPSTDSAPTDASERVDPAPAPSSPDDATPAPDPDDLLAEAMGGDATADDGERPPDESPAPDGGAAAAPDGTDRTTLRITRDVGEIFGVDEREYELASEDVVTLPTPNAEPLLDRDAAERLDD